MTKKISLSLIAFFPFFGNMLPAQISLPCNQWYQITVNPEIGPEGDSHFSGPLYSTDGILYVNQNNQGQDPNGRYIVELDKPNYNVFRYINNIAPPGVDFYSEIQMDGDDIFFVGTDNRIHLLSYMGTGNTYVHKTPNWYASYNYDGYFDVGPLNKIYFNSIPPGETQQRVHSIVGSKSWETGPLMTSGPYSIGDIECAMTPERIYFIGNDKHIYYYYWDNSAWAWTYTRANASSSKAYSKTELVFDEVSKVLFYVGDDMKVRFISGIGVNDQGVLNSSAPNVSAVQLTDLAYDNGKIVYLNSSNRFHMLYKNSTGNWGHFQMHSSAKPAVYSRFDFDDSRGLLYTTEAYRIAELRYHSCPLEDDGGTGRNGTGVVKKSFASSPSRYFDLKVYPNPAANGKIRVGFDNGVVEDSRLVLMNSNGEILQLILVRKGTREISIDVSDIAAGSYLLRFTNSTIDHSQLMVKE